jgi:hypothetical protein
MVWFFGVGARAFVDQMPNPFVISILTLITTLATTPTIANTNLNSGFVFNDRVKLYFYDKRVASHFFTN